MDSRIVYNQYYSQVREQESHAVILDRIQNGIVSGIASGSAFVCRIRMLVAESLIRHPKRILYSLAVIFSIMICCILFHSSPMLNAQTDHENTKYFTVIEVKDGDTLWKIAEEYKTSEYSSIQEYMEEVRKINHITGDEITNGCFLTVPYFAEEPMNRNGQ